MILTDLRDCRVRITDPPEGGYQPRIVALTPFNIDQGRPSGDALQPGDPQVPQALHEMALEAIRRILDTEIQRLVVGLTSEDTECVFDPARPILRTNVELEVETFVEFDGAAFKVRGTMTVLRSYFQGLCDVVRLRG